MSVDERPDNKPAMSKVLSITTEKMCLSQGIGLEHFHIPYHKIADFQITFQNMLRNTELKSTPEDSVQQEMKTRDTKLRMYCTW